MKRLFACLIALMLIVPSALADMPQHDYAYVVSDTSDRVHLRAAPSQDAASLGLYFTGTRVTLLGPLGSGWTQVEIGTERGYMYDRHLSIDPGYAYLCDARYDGRVKTTSFVNLREAPSKSSASLMKLHNGDRLIISGETDDHWYRVRFGDVTGYVMAKFVTLGDRTLEPITPAVPDAFVGVMTGHETLHFVPANEYLHLNRLSGYYQGAEVSFPFFAVADVNRDGREDIVLTIQLGSDPYYGYLVLTTVEGNVWGYEFPYRAMQSLKADGTFSFSSGALDSGFGYASFGMAANIIPMTESASQGDAVIYRINGSAAGEADFHQAVQLQEQKPDAMWKSLYLP